MAATTPTPQQLADRLADAAKTGNDKAFHGAFTDTQNADPLTRAATYTNLRNR